MWIFRSRLGTRLGVSEGERGRVSHHEGWTAFVSDSSLRRRGRLSVIRDEGHVKVE